VRAIGILGGLKAPHVRNERSVFVRRHALKAAGTTTIRMSSTTTTVIRMSGLAKTVTARHV